MKKNTNENINEYNEKWKQKEDWELLVGPIQPQVQQMNRRQAQTTDGKPVFGKEKHGRVGMTSLAFYILVTAIYALNIGAWLIGSFLWVAFIDFVIAVSVSMYVYVTGVRRNGQDENGI